MDTERKNGQPASIPAVNPNPQNLADIVAGTELALIDSQNQARWYRVDSVQLKDGLPVAWCFDLGSYTKVIRLRDMWANIRRVEDWRPHR